MGVVAPGEEEEVIETLYCYVLENKFWFCDLTALTER